MIKSWSDEWLLRLNIDKCKCVSYCIKHPTDTGYYIMDRNQLFPLDKVESMVDLGVRFDNNLTFTIRYDTRCYFNVHSKADISQLNLPHGTDN